MIVMGIQSISSFALLLLFTITIIMDVCSCMK